MTRWRGVVVACALLACASLPALAQVASSVSVVPVSGELAVRDTLRDPLFGVSARAPGLRRTVEMWQWQQSRDAAGALAYQPIWSARAIDSRDFSGAGAHANPPMPFASAQWWAANAVLGGQPVAQELLQGLDGWQTLPADAALLPANLAAVFRAEGDALISGEDLQHPQIGDLRVSWQVLPPGPVHGTAITTEAGLRGGPGTGLVRGVTTGDALPGLAQGARPGSDLLLWLAGAAALSLLLLAWLLARRR